jgi:iron-sulfur cluster repair protein YtfE (RIC family)
VTENASVSIPDLIMCPTRPLPLHHKHCDDLFAAAEAAAHKGHWVDCKVAFQRFRHEMNAHFATEEDVLFPAFERASGMTGGPTQMMRFEHAQMRDLLAALATSVVAADANGFCGTAETLLIMMQQHNMKEESILYPMCDRVLAGADLPVDKELLTRVASV